MHDQATKRRVGRIRISGENLLKFLRGEHWATKVVSGIEPLMDARIVHISLSTCGGHFDIYIEGPNVPEVESGGYIPLLDDPTYAQMDPNEVCCRAWNIFGGFAIPAELLGRGFSPETGMPPSSEN